VTFGCFRKNSGSFPLHCPKNRHINIQGAILGRSKNNKCWRECCQSGLDCRVPAPTQHIQHLKDTCNGKKQCRVQVKQLCYGRDGDATDYEYVTYLCELPGKLSLQHTTCRRVYFENYVKLMGKNVKSVKENLCQRTTNDLPFCNNKCLALL